VEGPWFDPRLAVKLTPISSLVNDSPFWGRAGMVSPVSVLCEWVGYRVNLRHGTSSAGTLKIGLSQHQYQRSYANCHI